MFPDVSFGTMVLIGLAIILITLPISLKKRTERMIVVGWCLILVVILFVGVWFFSTHDIDFVRTGSGEKNQVLVYPQEEENETTLYIPPGHDYEYYEDKTTLQVGNPFFENDEASLK